MHVQYHKKCLFEKEILSQVTIKQSTVFSLNKGLKNTHRHNWKIQMDWKNEI